MGGTFDVDVVELGNFLKTLKEAENSLDKVRTALRTTSSGEIGTKDLDSACDEFQQHWKYGAEQISDQAKKIKEGLEKTKQNYEEVEKSLEESFKKASAQGGGK
ncbi:hypothetical protein ACFW9F_03355 [Streptomyces sp. NPDC059506]|uniref:hypothetical protein n=1 Tax=unclassified Streptomyces TaxID=2593676 RepID=UPI000CB3AEE9|nr:hypothetical protein [Streptomyces sp. SCUT-3]PLW71730.1 hypothetical protein C0036_16290 [Streptomyces sp. DJ]QMV22063.1 hypothetical protein GQS52_10020 [Streptomyces sp. SCUT-3]